MKFLDKKKIKEALNIADIVQRYSSRFEIKRKIIVFLCPFHDDRNLGSCYAYLDSHKFTCESCKETADVLKLASAYTGIPLTEMNDLLERIVEDFRFNRDAFLKDSEDRNISVQRVTDEELLTDDEYIKLVGSAVIKKAAETKQIVVAGDEQTVVTRYDYLYYRTLAKRNKTEYDEMLCNQSRVIWRKLSSLARRCDEDYELSRKVYELFDKAELFDLAKSSSESWLKKALIEKKSAKEIIEALIADNNTLLLKGIFDKDKFTEEMTLRKNIEDREILKLSILKKLRA